MNKRILASICLFCFSFSSLNIPSFADEDLYYLENEIRETKAKFEPMDADLKRMENFMAGYSTNHDNLKKAWDELTELEEKQQTLLRNNLVKSTIVLGMETVGKINLVLGFYQQSVKMIVLACTVEVASNQMQNSFSSAFKVAVKGLSDETKKVLPELEEVQKTLEMSLEDVKAEALKGGDNLGETGQIYRKFYMVLDAIKKAKEALHKLRMQLEEARANVEKEMPAVKEETERLKARLDQLNERLGLAYQAMLDKKNSELTAQAKTKAVVNVTPVPMPVKDDEERQRLIIERVNLLSSQAYTADCTLSQQMADLRSSVTKTNPYSGSTYSPMDAGPFIVAAIEIRKADLPSMGFAQLRAERDFAKLHMSDNKENITKFKSAAKALDTLRQTTKDTAQPLLNQLAGLGQGGFDSTIDGAITRIAQALESMPAYVTRLEKENEICDKNLKIVEAEFADRVQIAKSFCTAYKTEAQNAVNAASYVWKRAKAVCDLAQNAGVPLPGQANLVISTIRSDVNKMYSEGRAGDIKSYLEKEKAKIMPVFESGNSIERLKRLRQNTADKFYMKMQSERGYGYMKELAEYFPDEGVTDADKSVSAELSKFQYTERSEKDIDEAIGYSAMAYNMADTITSFMPFAQKLEDMDKQIRSAFDSKDYMEAFAEFAKVREELAPDQEMLSKWVPYGAVQGKYEFKFISQETQEAMKNAAARNQKKVEDENKRISEELMKKKNDDDFDRLGYTIYNARINSKSLTNASGEVRLLKGDLKQGMIEISGRISNMHNVKAVLFSEDGGMTWKELSLAEEFAYSFVPFPDKVYVPIIKLKIDGRDDVEIRLFQGIRGIIYTDSDYTNLILETVKKISDSYEAENISMFSECVSREFLGNKTFLEEGVRFDFDMFTDIRLSLFVNRIEQRGNLYVAEMKWDKTQTPRITGQQQRTSGITTMVFVLEDGKMKIQNLRGNLIFATLSWQIAETSGLNSTVISEIRTAHDERNPVQPGAGDTENSGGVTASGLRTGTAHMTSLGAWTDGFDFSSGTVVGFSAGDIGLETNAWAPKNGAGIQPGTGSYGSITTAPQTGYTTSGIEANATTVGNVYIFRTTEGMYGKLEVTASTDDLGGNTTVDFRYSLQTDLSTNIAT